MSSTPQPTIVWENPETPVTIDDYIFQNGKRFVRPYFFEFIAHVKERWDMKTIATLFAEEFRQRPLEYYVQAVDSGRILVDGKLVTNKYVVRASQTLSHFVHRHEPPVMANSVTVLEVGTDIITVCKPSSVPVHPCGQYRKNTVLGLLQAEHSFGTLYPIHRLDRLVSGLLILARNARTADHFRQEIEAGTVQKFYIAKVRGVFPDEEVELNAAVIYNAKEGFSTVEEAVNLTEIKTSEKSPEGENSSQNLSKKDATQSQGRKAKNACTRFRKLYSDGVHSIVECIPRTGRTHQIRVHLQYLGHPIANDALYGTHNPAKRTEVGTSAERAATTGTNNKDVILTCETMGSTDISTNPCFKRQRTSEDSVKTLQEPVGDLAIHSAKLSLVQKPESKKDQECFCSELLGNPRPPKSVPILGIEGKDVELVVDPMCTHCPSLSPLGYEGEEQGLWLHCRCYSGQGWKYECPVPDWAVLPSSCTS